MGVSAHGKSRSQETSIQKRPGGAPRTDGNDPGESEKPTRPSRTRRTFALDAATGRLVWRFPDGEYSPVIADRERLYLTGFTSLYGLSPAG